MHYGTQNRRRLSPAFTLVELLVVIFIIAILILLILGAVHYAQRSSKIAKTKADLAAISTAIEQYHSDFKFYPGLPNPPPGTPIQYTILAQALVGPGPATEDGADGPGFRTVINPATGTFDPNSKKWDAYLSPEHIKVQRFARGWAFVDYFGNPIRYYPKRRNFNPKVSTSTSGLVNINTGVDGMFDVRDGEHPQTGVYEINADTLQVIVGDSNNTNSIDGDESLLVEGNFILASSGSDGLFTLYVAKENSALRRQKATKSDDIFNLDR
ncbi:MAG TPA: prepilin-type N-terminal cleavage/methylation domain-containing protein [Tepidisphaeraceae bacterium]|jgi:prepilin-type N-terminal cleavage/methylation domain-containing protein|nr:prepilin-type N-terminal cleavage/methylation domain-containing protein [Tepidisphaeraceae bacterium]